MSSCKTYSDKDIYNLQMIAEDIASANQRRHYSEEEIQEAKRLVECKMAMQTSDIFSEGEIRQLRDKGGQVAATDSQKPNNPLEFQNESQSTERINKPSKSQVTGGKTQTLSKPIGFIGVVIGFIVYAVINTILRELDVLLGATAGLLALFCALLGRHIDLRYRGVRSWPSKKSDPQPDTNEKRNVADQSLSQFEKDCEIMAKLGDWIDSEWSVKVAKKENPNFNALPYPQDIIEDSARRLLKSERISKELKHANEQAIQILNTRDFDFTLKN